MSRQGQPHTNLKNNGSAQCVISSKATNEDQFDSAKLWVATGVEGSVHIHINNTNIEDKDKAKSSTSGTI